jgi:hypothetical protein
MTAIDSSPDRDPRTHVTPHAFGVTADLLGIPLGSPWRRLAALGVDLVLVFFFTQLGGFSLSLLIAAVVFWLGLRRARTGRWWVRTAVVIGAFFSAVVAFLVTLSVVYLPKFQDGQGPGLFAPGIENFASWASYGYQYAGEDPEAQEEAARELLTDLAEQGASEEDLLDMITTFGLPVEAFSGLDTQKSEAQDSESQLPPQEIATLLEDYAASLRGEAVSTDTNLEEKVRQAVAGEELEAQSLRIERQKLVLQSFREDNEALRSKVENPSLVNTLRALGADLGLTLGWGGVYFTLMLVIGRGRTPGKRLLGLRVVRLRDGGAPTLWGSFERFAGYAAGLATGLLGFAQIFWDPNRQGIHDKIVGTVVVREHRN